MRKYLIIVIIFITSFQQLYSQDLLGGEFRMIALDPSTVLLQAKVYTDANFEIQHDFLPIELDVGWYYYMPRVSDTLLTPNIRLSIYEYEPPTFVDFSPTSVNTTDSVDASRIANVLDTGNVSPLIGTYIQGFDILEPETPLCSDIMNVYNIVNDTLYYQINCTDSFNSAIYYSIEPNLLPYAAPINFTIPSGVVLDSTSGLFTWAHPPDSGRYWFTVQVYEVDEWSNISAVFRLFFFDFDDPVPLASNSKEIEARNHLQVFPNPTKNRLTIQFDYHAPQNTQIQIFDMVGRMVHQQAMTQQREQLNIGHLASGMYLVRVVADGKVWTRKVVKN